MKRKLTPAARAAMAAGGRKAPPRVKIAAGRKGWQAMIETQARILARHENLKKY